MTETRKPLILNVDDDESILTIVNHRLSKAGYEVISADRVSKVQELLKGNIPDLILLDIMMPEMDGYQFCAQLKQTAELAYVPVVFFSALETEVDKKKAFAAGAADYITKNFELSKLPEIIKKNLRTGKEWEKFKTYSETPTGPSSSLDFLKFKEILSARLNLSPESKKQLSSITPTNIYPLAATLGIPPSQMAKEIALYLKLKYVEQIYPEEIQLDVLPVSFCKCYKVLAIRRSGADTVSFVLSNPFDQDLLDLLRQPPTPPGPLNFLVAEPKTIDQLFSLEGKEKSKDGDAEIHTIEESDTTENPITKLTTDLLTRALQERASDIHIEPM
ncbi:MAG: response regulator [Elusimicrobia bacterium]|nr:response regulator [Elusimicrobiota bacterium]